MAATQELQALTERLERLAAMAADRPMTAAHERQEQWIRDQEAARARRTLKPKPKRAPARRRIGRPARRQWWQD